ncbi:MAG: hypothetical protein IT335_12985 [Thermomicrobiales bacterium]|nr:hypothetical protein [Thermomicrobiales bacterium]
MSRRSRPESDLTPFGRWLMDRLDERDMTRAQLSQATGIRTGHISRMIYESPPESWLCAQIAHGLMIPVDEALVAAGHRPADAAPDTPLKQELANLINSLPERLLAPLLPMLRALKAQERAVLIRMGDAMEK